MNVTFVVGATCSGKSAWALKQALNSASACLVNCDSIQVYEGLRIGSAAPSKDELKQIPHYLFSYVPCGGKMTAGQYARDFFKLMDEIKSLYQYVFVVGGTGFYFQAIEKGLYPTLPSNSEIKMQLEEILKTNEGESILYKELLEKDPLVARKISSHDHYRLVRALEIIRSEGRSLSDIQNEFNLNQKKFPFPLTKVGIKISKEELLPRVQKRTQWMIENGLIEEVQNLIQQGFSDWEALQSVGYRETLMFLCQDPSIPTKEDLFEKIVQNTMKLAKKQRTWFKRDLEIKWIESSL